MSQGFSLHSNGLLSKTCSTILGKRKRNADIVRKSTKDTDKKKRKMGSKPNIAQSDCLFLCSVVAKRQIDSGVSC